MSCGPGREEVGSSQIDGARPGMICSVNRSPSSAHLGVVHNCHHFRERTQRTLFCDPPPKSVGPTLKMLIRNNPYQNGRAS